MNFNKKEVQVAQERKLFTGLTYVTPIIANPTTEELTDKLGYKTPKETSYHKDKEGVDTMKLEIHVENTDKTRGKITLWLERQKFVSKSGKTQFISGIGKTHWAVDKNELDSWLKEDSKVLKDKSDVLKGFYTNEELSGTKWREAYVGEERLYEFLLKLLRADLTDKTQEIKLKESIFTDKGIKELNTLFEKNKDCKVGVLFTVKGGYQNIYSNTYSVSFTEENTTFSKKEEDIILENIETTGQELTKKFMFVEYNPSITSLSDDGNKEENLPF